MTLERFKNVLLLFLLLLLALVFLFLFFIFGCIVLGSVVADVVEDFHDDIVHHLVSPFSICFRCLVERMLFRPLTHPCWDFWRRIAMTFVV